MGGLGGWVPSSSLQLLVVRRNCLCSWNWEMIVHSPPSGTDTYKCQAIIFPWLRRNVSVGLAQAPSSALAALTSDCQSPKLAMIAACLSTSACCHPTPVLVGCFRNAWRAESLLSAGEWGYCIFRYFLKPWGDNSSWETELQGARCVSILYRAETQPALADRSWASWANCLWGWRWGCTTRHCAGSYSCWSSAIWEWGSACITCHNNTSAHAKWVPLSSP